MLRRRSKPRDCAQRLRLAVDAMPRRAREAMLRGIDDNTIVVGAYSDPASGGICPMLAAHRNGGRMSLASFARSWDRYTDARRPRLATPREVRTLRSFLEMSLVAEDAGTGSLAAAGRSIRADRAALAEREATTNRIPVPTGERHRGRELRSRRLWSWILPARDYDVFRQRIAAASEQLTEQELAAATDASAERARERATAN